MFEKTIINGIPHAITDTVLVEYDVFETDEERKKRIALGLPTPKYSMKVSRVIPKEDTK